MINTQDQTECIICGKMRIFSKTWKDRLNDRGNVVTHTESVCPDAECQKKVDMKFAEIRERKEASEERRKSAALLKKVGQGAIPKQN